MKVYIRAKFLNSQLLESIYCFNSLVLLTYLYSYSFLCNFARSRLACLSAWLILHVTRLANGIKWKWQCVSSKQKTHEALHISAYALEKWFSTGGAILEISGNISCHNLGNSTGSSEARLGMPPKSLWQTWLLPTRKDCAV